MSHRDKPSDKGVESKPESQPSERRRRLLAQLTAGGAAGAMVPGTWAKPVVDAVVLPAHAETTTGTVTGGGGGSSGGNTLNTIDGLLGGMIGSAMAEPAEEVQCIQDYCVGIEVGPNEESVKVVQICFNACIPGEKWEDQTEGDIDLTESPPDSGIWRSSATPGGYELIVSNINLSGSTLADVSFDGVSGTIVRGVNCNCPSICEDTLFCTQ